jgi:2'-5' RNA ligase
MRVTREPTRRLFFALWPDEVLRVAFARATHRAVEASCGRPVPAHNLHATLLFLGPVDESRVPEVQAIGARGVGLLNDSSAPGLVFDLIEHWKKPRVLVATTSAASGPGFMLANALVEVLRREMTGAGFMPDLKPFRAHVTVARKVARVSQALQMEEVRWPVTGLALVESVVLAEGPRYDLIDSWALSP